MDATACCGCCGWNTGAVPSEDSFGHYEVGKINSLFSCTAVPSSTTEYWIGSIVTIPRLDNTCYDIWQVLLQTLSWDAIFAIGSDIYTLNNGIDIRCAFIDLGDGSAFVGGMSEHASLSNEANPGGPLHLCSLMGDCAYHENDILTAETSLLYRWSHDRIAQYRLNALSESMDATPYLLFTCNKDITLTNDYMLLPFHLDFLTTTFVGICYDVTKSNIRGYTCDNTVVNFWQTAAQHFHVDSYSCICGCCTWNTDAIQGSFGEDSFGLYATINPIFSCSVSPSSTTDYWIGSKVQIPSLAPTNAPSSPPSNAPSNSPSYSPSAAPSDNPTQAPSTPPTLSPTFSPSLAPSNTPSSSPSSPPTSSPTLSPSVAPSISPSLAPSGAPSVAPSLTPSFPPSNSPSLAPSIAPSLSPTTSPSLAPSIAPTTPPSNAPSLTPSIAPSLAPSVSPTVAPTISPSLSPSVFPSLAPSISPSLAPSIAPSVSPSLAPSLAPSIAPSIAPSVSPSTSPSLAPTIAPSMAPSIAPTLNPTLAPSIAPTMAPTITPTQPPSNTPTFNPTFHPTNDPTVDPTIDPTFDPTFDPTNDPTFVPTNDPTVDPTSDPTFDPTFIPTSDPTHDPTSDPTADPTKQPTATYHPTRDPTNDPTIDPTLQPTHPTNEPTVVPTVHPTYDPTVYPTFNPTIPPTNAPSFPPTKSPSFAPVFSPTQAPTRYPTTRKEYDSYFMITYAIKHLEPRFIHIFLNNILQITDDIIEKIEQSYLESTGLKYQFFSLHIQAFLELEIQEVNHNQYAAFANAEHGITVQSKIECSKHACKALSGTQFYKKYVDEFESVGTNKLRQYFDNYDVIPIAEQEELQPSQLIFEILNYGSFQVLYPTEPLSVSQFMSQNKILVILCAILIVMSIISLFALVHLKTTEIDSIWFAPLIYGIQFAAVVIDITVCVEIMHHDEFTTDLRITICGISCAIFILIPYYANIYFGGKVVSMIPKQHENAILFFESRRKMFMCFIAVCGGCYPSIFLLSSNIFGCTAFNSGLLGYELKKLNKIKIVSGVILQHLPQICIQCTISGALHMISPNVAFAFIISILSIICTPIAYKNLNRNHFSYHVQITMVKDVGENDDITYDKQREKFESNKGKTQKMSAILCEAFNCDSKCIEISRNSRVDMSKVTLYVMQFVDYNDMNLRPIRKLYLEKQEFLKDRFKQHFNLNGECMVIVKCDDTYSTTTDNFDAQKFLTTNLALSTDGGGEKGNRINYEVQSNIELQTIKNVVFDPKQEEIIKDIFNEEENETSESDIDFTV